MSNIEAQPAEVECRTVAQNSVAQNSVAQNSSDEKRGRLRVEVLTSRDVPLGGPRAMTVHRTVPQRSRSLIGAWCFADHYGPDDVSTTGGMDVPPHPHTGLQTASWLFTGEIEHRDTMGNHAMVRPGELNLMTAGHGIAHTEVSTPDTTVLHGVQLWIALPADAVDTPRDFAHYAPPLITVGEATARVFLGELLGSTSPVHTFTPLLGAELHLPAGAEISLDVRDDFEHGFLVDTGRVEIVGSTAPILERTELGYVGLGANTLTLRNHAEHTARIVVLGGAPLNEDIVMWWNFIGRSHDDIVAFREEWVAHSERFGQVQGYTGDIQHLPAPTLPGTRLRARENVPGRAQEK
ncbi:pirin family protein [Gordonia sp. L191]|uniref:pirin family protein n=1 Tax=Gordonia sp. L191 TaxID=2982699 RepID=UPI0024BF1A7D|nr:pirin family protein [Gordonia sp. L191]WHU48358.1 pirin family protein [Gordonia sp. L191]